MLVRLNTISLKNTLAIGQTVGFYRSCLRRILLGGLFIGSIGEPLANQRKQSYHILDDWRPFSSLNEEQKKQVKPGCRGLYLDPLAGNKADDLEIQDLNIEADNSAFQQGESLKLEGDVFLRQGNRHIYADQIHFDLKTEALELSNGVLIRQPDMALSSQRARADRTRNQASFEHAHFLLHSTHLRGSAEAIEQSDNLITLKKGLFTTCEPEDDSWLLKGERIQLNTATQQGVGRNLSLRILDVPVLYIPYIRFPIGDQRQTGFLYPTIASSQADGLDISLPWYWNIAPNYDALLTPRHIEHRGSMLSGRFRHLNRRFESGLDLAFLADDQGGIDEDIEKLIEDGTLDENEAYAFRGQDRWLVGLQQIGGKKQSGGKADRWYSLIDYTRVSDRDYFRDLNSSAFAQASNTYLNQHASLKGQFGHWQVRGMVQDYQVLLKDLEQPYQILPRIDVNGRYNWSAAQFYLQNEYTRFTSDNATQIAGDRFSVDYRLNRAFRRTWGFLKPELGYKSSHYQLDEKTLQANADNAPHIGAAQLSLDAGLVFEHPGGRFLQTLEPRLFYLNREEADHQDLYNIGLGGENLNFDTSLRAFSYAQLYRDTQFNGRDRLDDDDRLTVGLSSNWSQLASGQRFASFNIGQVIYFDEDREDLDISRDDSDYSPYAAELGFYLGNTTSLDVSVLYSEKTDSLQRMSTRLNWHSSDYLALANLNYNLIAAEDPSFARDTDVEQADFSFAFPIKQQWELVGKFNYDISFEQELEAFLGLEYSSCCYGVKFLARRWLDSNIASLNDETNDLSEQQYDDGVFFEFELKGLGGSGKAINSILSESIPGYDNRTQ